MFKEELEEKVKQLSILYSVSANIGATTSADEVLRIVLDEATEFLRAEIGVICLFDRDRKNLVIKEVLGISSEIVGSKIDPNKGIIGKVVAKGGSIVQVEPKEFDSFLTPHKPKMIVVFPVKVKEELRAFLYLGNFYHLHLSKEENWLLTIMTRRMGIALETAELYSELKEAKEELINKERIATLGQLASEAAHEIRNPLNVIKAGTYLLKKRFNDDEWTQKKVFQIENAANRIAEYIDDLLELSKLSIKSPIYEVKETDINILINDVVMEFSTDRFLGVEIVQDLGEIPKIRVNRDRIKDAVINLIKNASEAMNHNNGNVILRTGWKNNAIQLEVSDTGGGIPEDKIKDIFNPFVTTKHKGTGLGLTIVKKIIEAHGGEIGVESKPGKGTTFTITLPIL